MNNNKYKYDNFTVIIDTREQQPWSFENYTVANRKLDTGDYSVEGLEEILCIERKQSVSEFANNITEPRFKDVVERMSKYKYSFLLLEFDLENVLSYPVGSDVPRRMWEKLRISPAFILKHIIELQIYHNIKVLFCGNASNANNMAMSLMRKIDYIEHKHNQK
jgi:ERCC4-type nuclease